VPPEKRVYVDESGISEYPRREFGRAPRGEKVSDVKQGKRFGRVNVIGALCAALHLCVECYRHATNAEFFEDWFENRLLQAIPWGEAVSKLQDTQIFMDYYMNTRCKQVMITKNTTVCHMIIGA